MGECGVRGSGAPKGEARREQTFQTARSNSLSIREFTANFAIQRASWCYWLQNHDMISNRCHEIPCAKERGIYLGDRGMVLAISGKNSAGNRSQSQPGLGDGDTILRSLRLLCVQCSNIE